MLKNYFINILENLITLKLQSVNKVEVMLRLVLNQILIN